MRMVYQLGAETDKSEEILDLENDFYACTYKSTIKTRSGQVIAQCEGSCNTNESKYKYRWVKCFEEFDNEEYQKLKAKGTHKKRRDYDGNWETLERVENDNKVAIMNTIQKMAQKRAFVGAMVIAVGASEFYTQDLDDLAVDLGVEAPDHIQEGEIEKTPEAKQTPKAAPKKQEKAEPKVYDTTKELTEKEKVEIRKGDHRADGTEKPWFNEKPNFEKFKEGPKDMFKTYQQAIDEITLNYKVNREMRGKIQALYK
jgi:hypothetical protein